METDAASLARSFRTDPEMVKVLPARPRLVPGLHIVPLRAEEVLILGGDKPVHLRGKGARGQFLHLVSALNGERDLTDLATKFPSLTDDDIFEVICILHVNGLTVDGVGEDRGAFAQFATRKVGHSRHHTDGSAAAALLADTRLLIVAPEQLLDALRSALRDAGFGEVEIAPSDQGSPRIPANVNLALVIEHDQAEAAARWYDACYAADLPAFRIALGERSQIGPLILPQRSACINCVGNQVPKRIPSERIAAHLSLAVHRFTMMWSRIGKVEYHNRVLQWSAGLADEDEYITIIREPGCVTCSLDHLERVTGEEAEIFRRNFQSELSPKAFLAPSYHLIHYSPANIYATLHKNVATSSAGAYPFRPDIVERNFGADHQLARLAKFMAVAFGYRPHIAGGMAIRYVPSGGGLDSPTPYLALRNVPDFPDGIFRYAADTQALEPVPSLSQGSAFFSEGDGAQIRLIVLASYKRIFLKYKASAMRICGLDAGVSLLNAVHLDRVFGCGGKYTLEVDAAAILSEFNFPRSVPVEFFPTYVAIFDDVGEPPAAFGGAPPAALEPWMDHSALTPLRLSTRAPVEVSTSPDFLRLVETRRSYRSYLPVSIDRATLLALVEQARILYTALPLPNLELGLIVRVTQAGHGLECGTYRIDLQSGMIDRCEGIDYAPEEFANQSSLTEAPLIFFVTGTLYSAVRTYGYAGWRTLLMNAGALGSALWLASSRVGLGGCIFGGLIESAARTAAGVDGYEIAPMLGFSVGHVEGGA